MRFVASVFIIACSIAVGTYSIAQAPTTSQAPARAVIAQAKLSSVNDKPITFRVVKISLKAGQKESLTNTDSIAYELSGSVDASSGSPAHTIGPEAALYIPAGSVSSLSAKNGDSATMVFQLIAAGTKGSESGNGTVNQLYQGTGALPGLKAGSYDFNLTRVTFPARMPPNAPHHRTGGALYYVISGTGANVVAGKTYNRGPGVFIYEPAGLVHQWGNPGTEALTFLAFNINPEGVPPVAQETAGNP